MCSVLLLGVLGCAWLCVSGVCWAVLCCALLCCAWLCCAVLCFAVLFCCALGGFDASSCDLSGRFLLAAVGLCSHSLGVN